MRTKNDATVALPGDDESDKVEGDGERSGPGVIASYVYWEVMGFVAMVKSKLMTIDFCINIQLHWCKVERTREGGGESEMREWGKEENEVWRRGTEGWGLVSSVCIEETSIC